MSWRLPPPIWLVSRRQTVLGALLQLGAIGWRLAKWCVAAGLALVALDRFTAAAQPVWRGAGWVTAGAVLVFLWERYGLADMPWRATRAQRLCAAAALLAAAGAGTWLVAHFTSTVALSVFGAPR